MLFGRNQLKAIAAVCFLWAGNAFSANPLMSDEQKIAAKLVSLEAQFEVGEISQLEITLFKARALSRKDVLLEPSLSESEQGVFRNLRMLAETNTASALAAVLLEINDKTSARFDFVAGNLYAERQDLALAKVSYLAAVTKFPNYLEAHKNLGIVCVRLEDWALARASLLKAYSFQESVDADVVSLLGLCYSNEAEWATAELFYKQAEGAKLVVGWQMGLANALLKQGKNSEAVPILEALYADELLEKRNEARQTVTRVDTQPVPLELNVGFTAIAGDPSSGHVVIEFLVTQKGEAVDARIIESSDARFQKSSLLAIRNSKWTPAMLNGKSVSVRVRKKFVFGNQ